MNKEITKKTLTIFAFIMPTLIIGIVFFSMYFLPESIPVHFDLQWNITRVGAQYEILILGLVFYFIPIIISMIYKNVKFYLSKIIGLVLCICVSLVFYGVTINMIVRIFMNSQVVIVNDAGRWLSFVMTIIGVACIGVSSLTILKNKNLLLKNKENIMFVNAAYNKINFILSVILFLFGATVCVGCTLLKNYYSFIVFFVGGGLFSLICYLTIRLIAKKHITSQYN